MKGIVLTLLALTLSIGLAAQIRTCYDIQYTTHASGDSPYDGQAVSIQAIVTYVKAGSYYYLGDAAGGPWSGVYVYHGNSSNSMTVGDEVIINATVDEYSGLTELVSVSSFEIVSQGNPLPPPAIITTADLPTGNSYTASKEQWEGVFVRFYDVQIKSSPDSYDQFKMADTSNVQAMVDDQLYDYPNSSIQVNDNWYIMQGIVDYHYIAGYKLNPRSANDMIKQDSVANAIVTIPNVYSTLNTVTSVSVLTSKVKPTWGVPNYEMTFRINPAKVIFHGFDIAGTLTPMDPITEISANGDTIKFQVLYQEMLVANEDDMILINLLLEPLAYGEAIVDIISFKYDNIPLNSINDGKLLTKIQEDIAYLAIGNSIDAKNIFNPSLNEKITIEYGLKAGLLGKATVRIYDAQGRLVATPINLNLPNQSASLSIGTYQWNGRDANLNLLPPGLYYCHLEVIDRRTGKAEKTVQPIIIKSRLK